MIIGLSAGLITIALQFLYLRMMWKKLIKPNYVIYFANVFFVLCMVFIPLLCFRYIYGSSSSEALKNYQYSRHVWELFYVPSTVLLIYAILRGQKNEKRRRKNDLS